MSIQHLGAMTWIEVKEFVHERVIALLPVGSIEAHGPHLPLNTDVVIATEMARRAARKLANQGRDVLLCPPLVFAPAPRAMEFPGTVSVGPETFGAYLRSILAQMGGFGLRTLGLVTCHSDVTHAEALKEALGVLSGAMALKDLRIVLPELSREPWVHRLSDEIRAGGSHAGQFETACMLALQADKVRDDVRKELEAVTPEAAFGEGGATQAYTGDPAAASGADGERYLDALGELVADALLEGKA